MNLKWKTNKYTSKKTNEEVVEEILLIQKKDETEVGIGIKDVLVGKFKFVPRIREIAIKQGPNAGKSFTAYEGIMSFKNLDSKYDAKLNQYGNAKVDFTKAGKDYEFNKIGDKWETDDVAFFLRPYLNQTTQKTAWMVAMAPLTPLTQSQVDAALFLRQDETSFTDTDLSVEIEETKEKVRVPRWALLIPEQQLKELVK